MANRVEPLTVQGELLEECRRMAERARVASKRIAIATGSSKNAWLEASGDALLRQSGRVIEANEVDVASARESGLSLASIDRLTLDRARVEGIARAIREVASLPDPVGEVVASSRRPNGLDVTQLRVPLGVIFMIYESRPNVTADAAALCIKSGNAAILRGGKEARHSNRAIMQVLAEQLEPSGLPGDAVQLVETTDRDAVGHLLALPEFIDLAIPRGGESLIRRVVADALMPVLKHYTGNCHIYVDSEVDRVMALRVIENAKVQRPGVCNAVETVLIHREVAKSFLPEMARNLGGAGVELRGDERAFQLVPTLRAAEAADWDTEYGDLILAVGIVDDIDAAIRHIGRHGSGHTEAILTTNLANARRFVAEVDASAVVVNASTRFNDGGQLGLGAEIGISTDKFHARGPCGLTALTSTKWVIYGDGQVRG